MNSRTKAIASLSGIFLLGAFCGALVVGIVARNRAEEAERFRQREGFEMFIVDRLRLTEAQRDSLQDELERTFAEFEDLRASTADEYRNLLDTLKQRISPQLTPEQRALLSDMDVNFRRGFPGGKRHPHPPPPGLGPLPEDRPPLTSEPESSVVPGDSVKHPGAPKSSKGEKTQDQSSTTTNHNDELTSKDSVLGNPSKRIKGIVNSLDKQLSFSESQRQQVDIIASETSDKLDRAKKDLADDPAMLAMAYRQNMRDMSRRIGAVLTPEQQMIYKKLRLKRPVQ